MEEETNKSREESQTLTDSWFFLSNRSRVKALPNIWLRLQELVDSQRNSSLEHLETQKCPKLPFENKCLHGLTCMVFIDYFNFYLQFIFIGRN